MMDILLFISMDILIHSNIEVTIMEVHNLAYFYHWSRNECWELPCTERVLWNDRIKRQLKAESNSGNNSGSTPSSSYKESSH